MMRWDGPRYRLGIVRDAVLTFIAVIVIVILASGVPT